MAYSKEELEGMAIKAIEENELVFFREVSVFCGVSNATLYNHGIEDLDTVKEKLIHNKIKQKAVMRKKWRDSDNAALQISLYKLMAEQSELDPLTQNKIAHSGELAIVWQENKSYEPNAQTDEGSGLSGG